MLSAALLPLRFFRHNIKKYWARVDSKQKKSVFRSYGTNLLSCLDLNVTQILYQRKDLWNEKKPILNHIASTTMALRTHLFGERLNFVRFAVCSDSVDLDSYSDGNFERFGTFSVLKKLGSLWKVPKVLVRVQRMRFVYLLFLDLMQWWLLWLNNLSQPPVKDWICTLKDLLTLNVLRQMETITLRVTVVIKEVQREEQGPKIMQLYSQPSFR